MKLQNTSLAEPSNFDLMFNSPSVCLFEAAEFIPLVSNLPPLVRLLRPHQWTKNLLVFTPLFFYAAWNEHELLLGVLSFISLSALASASYCLNDIADREADRRHPTKRTRPIAAGEISPRAAVAVAVTLGIFAFALGSYLGPWFIFSLLLYLGLELAYTYRLKAVPVVDILLLAFLFFLRVLAGSLATHIEPSPWILIITWLISLMLATGKRLLERVAYGDNAAEIRPVLGQYSASYLRHTLTSVGSAALVCYLLWCSEGVATHRFRAAEIFPSSIIVAFVLLRYQLLVFNEKFDEDPARGLLRDRGLVLAVFVYVVYLGLVMY